MTLHYQHTMFTPAVKAAQTAQGSRGPYGRHDAVVTERDRLTDAERAFIAARDSFYLATVTETGWPYIQHRGGATGFVRALDATTLGFADFRGNRQYITLGNLSADSRAALFFMDYPNQARLKVMGRLRVVGAGDDPALDAQLRVASYKAHVERFILIDVEAFDWNCSQHITPRFTAEDIAAAVAPLHRRIAELEASLAAAGASAAT